MNIEKIKKDYEDKLSKLNSVINTIDYKDADIIYKKIRTVSMSMKDIENSPKEDTSVFLELKEGIDTVDYFSIYERNEQYKLIDFINRYKDNHDFFPRVYNTSYPSIEFTTWLRTDEIEERVKNLTKMTVRKEIEKTLGYNVKLNCKVMDLYKQKKINWEDVIELHKNCDI